jgi:glycosyltransferase involved in cell wall biosynthesis
MVSVIMSCFNKSDKTERAIESVLAQTYKDWELICVNDASTDNTKELLDSYAKKDKRIRVIHREKNFGNDTQPKNDGVKASKGEYISFLDNDNEFSSDHLMILVKEMEKQPADVIYGDRMVLSDDKDIDITPGVGIASDFKPGLLFERNFIDTSDVLIKREALFLVGGWDERYEKYVDWNLWVRMCKANCTFRHVPKVITNYYLSKSMKSMRVKDEVGKVPFGKTLPEGVFRPKWDGYELEIVLPFLGPVHKPKVAVFTLTKNRFGYTKRMYEKLEHSGYGFDWFIVDNGSTDGSLEWLRKLKPTKNIEKVTLIENKQNKGISISSNQALDAIGKDYDFIVKIDNDCEINTSSWLARMLYIFEAHWQIVLSPYVEGLLDNPGGAPRVGYKQLRKHLIGVTRHIGGIFTMTHKSAYDGFRWDEKDFLHSLQDVEFTQDVQKKGYLCGYVEDMKCAHMDTTEGQKKAYPEYFEERKYERTHTV